MSSTRGRPSLYTEEIAEEICRRISLGETLPQVCADPRMPDRITVMSWCDQNRAGFSDRYARARDRLMDHWADEIVSIGDTTQDGVKTTVKSDGKTEVVTMDMTEHRKLRIYTRQWLMARLRPDKYGDRSTNGSTELTVNIRSVLDAPAPVHIERPKGLPPVTGAGS